MALMFRVMSVQCPTARTGITFLPRAIPILTQVLQVAVLETILLMHSTTVKGIRFIKEQGVDSTIIIAMGIRPMSLNAILGDKRALRESYK
jgi:hypothetical protein